MKKIACILASMALGLGLTGCASTGGSTVNTKKGAVLGAAAGAAAGAVIGHQKGRGLEGAAVGAGAGALGGAVIGSAKDEEKNKNNQFK